jgi:hypothetical protein
LTRMATFKSSNHTPTLLLVEAQAREADWEQLRNQYIESLKRLLRHDVQLWPAIEPSMGHLYQSYESLKRQIAIMKKGPRTLTQNEGGFPTVCDK